MAQSFSRLCCLIVVKTRRNTVVELNIIYGLQDPELLFVGDLIKVLLVQCVTGGGPWRAICWRAATPGSLLGTLWWACKRIKHTF